MVIIGGKNKGFNLSPQVSLFFILLTMKILETKRTYLRPFLPSDLDSLLPMLLSDDVMKYTGFKKAQTETSSKELLEKWIKDPGVFAAIKKENNNDIFIGWFMLKNTVSEIYPEIGFMLEQGHWNKGYTTEIARGLLHYAQSELKVPKVIASTNLENEASIRVLKKIGMIESASYPIKKGVVYYEIILE